MKLATTRRGRFAIILRGLLFLILGTFCADFLFGRYLVINYLLFEYPLSTNSKASLRQLLHLDHSYSLAEGAQDDRWIARCLMPDRRDGFYVDVGAADGTISSNTKLLDELGWKGVCIDPFPTHMEDRTCQVFRQPVFSESGQKVTFRAAGELDALRGLSPEKYAVSAFTIETNGEADKREGIREFLESKGYVRVRSWAADDWYVRPELAKRFRFSVERWPRQFRHRGCSSGPTWLN
jgi:hypothetical protein